MWPSGPDLGRQQGGHSPHIWAPKTVGVCSALFMLMPCSHPVFYMGYPIIVTVSKKVGLESLRREVVKSSAGAGVVYPFFFGGGGSFA